MDVSPSRTAEAPVPSIRGGSLAANRTAGVRAGRLAVLKHHLPVYPHRTNTHRHSLRLAKVRAIGDGCGIEEHEIGEVPRGDAAAIRDADVRRRERGHLAD